jgi:predicted DNA-binding transcriptional regulator YafY
MTDERIPGTGRREAKRDRLARLLNVANILQAHGETGISADDVAARTDTSRRTAYRDIGALATELGLPIWSVDGRHGIDAKAFLPPLRLTLPEAMAVFLSARLMTRYVDKYDPALASAFGKLRDTLPPGLRGHVESTLGEMALRPRDATFVTHVADLTKAWSEGRVVRFQYAPAAYHGEAEPSWRDVRPYLLEPSLQTHALYLIGYDEGRAALRTFKVERVLDLSITPRTFVAPGPDEVAATLRAAWDIISDQPPVEVVLRFARSVGSRVEEATWHPTQEVDELADGSLEWRATVAGTVEIRLWILSWGDDVEVLAPAALRDDVAATHARAAARYGR